MWSQASNTLVSQRANHTATFLPGGHVLIAGGDAALDAPAELYDPATDRWSASAPLNTGRFEHTATLLQNGEVLVAGGLGARGPGDHSLNSVEIYNPHTQRWTELADTMSVPRAGHTATLLESGKVLVTGGHIQNRGASLYDPATQSWTDAGEMSIPRRHHTATLLSDGRVLVAGGESHHDQTGLNITSNSAEIYDPATNSWFETATMLGGRKSHVAVLLPDGKVLAAGGTDDSRTRLASAEIYDPESDTWSRTIWMAADRSHFTATVLEDGRVFVAGGCGADCLSPVEFFDPQYQTWTRVQDMNTLRHAHTTTLLPDGRLLAVGGICDCLDEAGHPVPTELLAPGPILQLPWSTHAVDGAPIWYYSHGPQCNSDGLRCPLGAVRYAISFMPPLEAGEDNCAPERQTRGWVTAAAGGEIRYAGDNLVEIHHGFGYRTGYYHLTELVVNPGDHVEAGQKLGRPSCETSQKFGGTAPDVQVRFYTCLKAVSPDSDQDYCGPVDVGEHVRAIAGLVLSGWTVTEGSTNQRGQLAKLTDKPRRSSPHQCGIDDGCRSTSKNAIYNDVPRQQLRNASFEMSGVGTGAKDWVAKSGTFVRTDDIPAQSGRFSGKFMTTQQRNVSARQELAGITAGQEHFVQGWVNVQPTTNEFSISIMIVWRDDSNEAIRTDTVAELHADTGGLWTNIGSPTEGFVAPRGTANALMTIRVEGSDVDVYVDDFLFTLK